jgi:hypothetical protein
MSTNGCCNSVQVWYSALSSNLILDTEIGSHIHTRELSSVRVSLESMHDHVGFGALQNRLD